MRYRGALYRALNPIYAADPLSGLGASKYGGRFNKIGRPALYTSLRPEHALREANQVGALQPTTLVSYEADLEPIFDTTDPSLMVEYETSIIDLAVEDWRDRMLSGKPVSSQDFAERLIDDGFVGMLVRSFAPANADGMNIVLWEWSDLTVIDDENRLKS